MSLDASLHSHFDQLMQSNKVVLFMKGSRIAPQCGFSARVVAILDEMVDDYVTVDVLEDPAVRQGIKEYSSWPTIPQLYVAGEFIGGCDIVSELHTSGELTNLLGPVEIPTPTIALTEDAAVALREAAGEDIEFLRFKVSPQFQYSFNFDDPGEQDVIVESGGIKLVLDHGSARRADGATIRIVDGENGRGLWVDNPNEPAKVQQLSVTELLQWMDADRDFHLFDVRTEGEFEIARIPGSILLDQNGAEVMRQLDRLQPIVLHCHHGGRSQRAATGLIEQGFTNVYNLAGGIDAWSLQIDPAVSRY